MISINLSKPNTDYPGTGGDAPYYTKEEMDALLEKKENTEPGKHLSTNDYTDDDKDKVNKYSASFLGQYATFDDVPSSGLSPQKYDYILITEISGYIKPFVPGQIYTEGMICAYNELVYRCILETDGGILPIKEDYFELTNLPKNVFGSWMFIYTYDTNIGKHGFYPQYQTSSYSDSIKSLIYAGL